MFAFGGEHGHLLYTQDAATAPFLAVLTRDMGTGELGFAYHPPYTQGFGTPKSIENGHSGVGWFCTEEAPAFRSKCSPMGLGCRCVIAFYAPTAIFVFLRHLVCLRAADARFLQRSAGLCKACILMVRHHRGAANGQPQLAMVPARAMYGCDIGRADEMLMAIEGLSPLV